MPDWTQNSKLLVVDAFHLQICIQLSVGIIHRLFEILYGLSQGISKLGKFSGSKNDQNDYQYNDKMQR